jgi:hypothetical protein
MDTKTLVVGQDVYMFSGFYGQTGEVVKVTPWSVEVQVGPPMQPADELFRFDSDGKGCDGKGTYECGPWELDDIPFAERTALIEQAAEERGRRV